MVRILECIEGSIEFAVECRPGFDYGTVIPHVALVEASDGYSQYGTLGAREKLYAAVTYQPFFAPVCEGFSGREIEQMLDETVRYWEEWSARCDYGGEHKDNILRSAPGPRRGHLDPDPPNTARPGSRAPGVGLEPLARAR